MRDGARRSEWLKDYQRLIHVDKDPVYSNVKGFYIRAEQLAQRPAAATASSTASAD